MTRRRQMRPWYPDHPPGQIRAPTEVGEPLESLWGKNIAARDGPNNPSRAARTRRLLERRTAALLTSPTRKCRAPPFGSQGLTIRRAVSAQLRRGGLSPTSVLMCALVHGPAWVSSPLFQTPVQGQHHSSRRSKTFSYQVWAASCMLLHLSSNSFHSNSYPLFRRHLTPSRERIRWERTCHRRPPLRSLKAPEPA